MIARRVYTHIHTGMALVWLKSVPGGPFSFSQRPESFFIIISLTTRCSRFEGGDSSPGAGEGALGAGFFCGVGVGSGLPWRARGKFCEVGCLEMGGWFVCGTRCESDTLLMYTYISGLACMYFGQFLRI